MKTAFATFLVLAALAAFAGAAVIAEEEGIVREIEVTAPAETAALGAVNGALNTVTEKVLECAQSREPPEACQCEYMEDLGRLKTARDDALRAHPEWNGAHVYYREPQGGITSVYFPGVTTRLEDCR